MGNPDAAKRRGNKSLKRRDKRKQNNKGGLEEKSGLNKLQIERREINQLIEQYDKIQPGEIRNFADFPLSGRTKAGLIAAGYDTPTEIQRVAVGLALQGNDVLGAAKTGSGKTLAFLIPILECLYRNSWSALDGLGALVISPTRELAYQTFEVLCKIGSKHDFSAGLVIGGKDLKTETERIPKTNIIICTPGRLLQHMDETACFESLNLQMLVLDEADRILDLGFQQTIDAILEHLPADRQTLLFSATQTKSVRDLARLSLQDPKYVAVHEHHLHSTPVQLEQSYIVCNLEHKLDILYSFIRAHLKQKILVFLSSCKQVKYVFEVFCKLKPGISVMALYGTLHQLRRVAVYEEFCVRDAAVLLATDIAARGLDFPAVNWVIQLDCPEDCNTYIHRVGRTARYEKDGEALLVLLPSEEEGMLAEMEKRKIPIEKIQVNPNKKMTIEKKLQSFCAQSLELKQSAQRAFIAYLKAIYLMKNKDIFTVHSLSLDSFARSLGLAVAPRVRFIHRAERRKAEQRQKSKENAGRGVDGQISKSAESHWTGGPSKEDPERDGRRQRTGSGESSPEDNDSDDESDCEAAGEGYQLHGNGGCDGDQNDDDDDDDDDDFLVKKDDDSSQIAGNDTDAEDLVTQERKSKKTAKPITKYTLARKLRKKNLTVNTKMVFDDEGQVQAQWPPAQPTRASSVYRDDDEEGGGGGIEIEKAKQFMEEEDKHDKQLFKERIKAKHRTRRLKEKERKRGRRKRDSDDEDEGDSLGTSLDVAGDAEHEFDPLSLPDPDKFSAFVPDDDDHEDGSENEQTNEAAGSHSTQVSPKGATPPGKRKFTRPTPGKKKIKEALVGSEEDGPMDTGMSLAEDEQLALHMLATNRF